MIFNEIINIFYDYSLILSKKHTKKLVIICLCYSNHVSKYFSGIIQTKNQENDINISQQLTFWHCAVKQNRLVICIITL